LSAVRPGEEKPVSPATDNRIFEGSSHEAYISAKPTQTGAPPRFPSADVDPRRPRHYQGPPRQGPQTPVRLSPRAAGSGRIDLIPVDSGARALDKAQMEAVDYGFPRSARLLNPSEFSRVFRHPSVSSDRYFKVLARYNDGRRSRLGMAVSRQVDKRAVVRNRIKRVIRESFRQYAAARVRDARGTLRGPESGQIPAVDLVVLPRRPCAIVCNEELFRSLAVHWSRLEQRLKDKDT
jgi:ribonuclease P protein component